MGEETDRQRELLISRGYLKRHVETGPVSFAHATEISPFTHTHSGRHAHLPLTSSDLPSTPKFTLPPCSFPARGLTPTDTQIALSRTHFHVPDITCGCSTCHSRTQGTRPAAAHGAALPRGHTQSHRRAQAKDLHIDPLHPRSDSPTNSPRGTLAAAREEQQRWDQPARTLPKLSPAPCERQGASLGVGRGWCSDRVWPLVFVCSGECQSRRVTGNAVPGEGTGIGAISPLFGLPRRAGRTGRSPSCVWRWLLRLGCGSSTLPAGWKFL